MGQLVTVAQCAWLVRRDQRAVRYHLNKGHLTPQTGEDGHMRLDLDAVAAVVGWTIDAGRLAELRAQESASPAGILAQLERLASELRAEREMRRALERRLTALEGLIARALGRDDAPEALDTYLSARSGAQEDGATTPSEGAGMALGYGSGMVDTAPSDFALAAPHRYPAIGLAEDARHILSDLTPRPRRAVPTMRLSSGLPEGFVSMAAFAAQHNIAETTVKKAAQSGRLPVHQGHWKHGRAYVEWALDADGRAAFFALWGDRPDFQRCAECPH